MRYIQFLAVIVTIIAVVAAAPSTPGQLCTNDWPEYFFLRANCTNEPWNKRHIVELPTSKQLGLENFTVSPTTPPVRFRPVQLQNGDYAMQVEGSKENPDRLPYLAALRLSEGGTHTLSMGVVYLTADSLKKRYDGFDGCPEGYECIINQWTFDPSGPYMIHLNFRFTGSSGDWEPFKDAGKEGWHVYWKGDAGLHHPIRLDLVPAMI